MNHQLLNRGLECTELPPYADALRDETKLPVFDAITNADAWARISGDEQTSWEVVEIFLTGWWQLKHFFEF